VKEISGLNEDLSIYLTLIR